MRMGTSIGRVYTREHLNEGRSFIRELLHFYDIPCTWGTDLIGERRQSAD